MEHLDVRGGQRRNHRRPGCLQFGGDGADDRVKTAPHGGPWRLRLSLSEGGAPPPSTDLKEPWFWPPPACSAWARMLQRQVGICA